MVETKTFGATRSSQTLLLEDGTFGGEQDELAVKFADDWSEYEGDEPSQFQNHFNALCRLVDHDTPGDHVGDPDFTFHRRTPKSDGSPGEADVFLRDRFVMEYKRANRSLDDAYTQALSYRDSLGNPPLILVSDFQTIRVHTNFTGTVSEVYTIRAVDFADGALACHRSTLGEVAQGPMTVWEVLRACFRSPSELEPTGTPEELTLKAAGIFREIATALVELNPRKDLEIAKFLSQLLFIMFASDMQLLWGSLLTEATSGLGATPSDQFDERLTRLIEKMSVGEANGIPPIPHFNGGLFDGSPLSLEGIHAVTSQLQEADQLDWSQIEPSVFGTMFERVFNPKKRSQFGMHYTSRSDIEQLCEPVLMAPLRSEWESTKLRVEAETDLEVRSEWLQEFVDRVGSTKVLDPACGSGNFLYVALSLLHDLEREVMRWASAAGIAPPKSRVHPRQLYGIEIDEYAHQLASVVIWIGHIQNNRGSTDRLRSMKPVLEPLDNVARRDAVMTAGEVPLVPEWPEADVIVGNPPFLGNKMMRQSMGDVAVDRLYEAWHGAVPHGADLCMYWFEKARQQIESGRAKRAGLLGTQGIRYGRSRKVLENILESGGIFFAISDQEWQLDGAQVQISMVGFDDGSQTSRTLDGVSVSAIHCDLNNRPFDLTTARRLDENLGIAFQGVNRRTAFEVPAGLASKWTDGDTPLRRRNREILKPIVTGKELNGEPRNKWLIDFGEAMSFDQAKDFEQPFEYLNGIFSESGNRRDWWETRPRSPAVREAISGLKRYLCTAHTSKHRIFTWLHAPVLPEHAVVVFARDDDYFFGVLQSSTHMVWAREIASQLREAESGTRYTHTSSFETFPMPEFGDTLRPQIEEAVRRIDRIRNERLAEQANAPPHERTQHTLTGIYNDPPDRLVDAHAALDRAVFRAYGWSEEPSELADEEVLSRLLELNLERAKGQ